MVKGTLDATPVSIKQDLEKKVLKTFENHEGGLN